MKSPTAPFNSDFILFDFVRILLCCASYSNHFILIMRSFLYHLFSLTTPIVASLSLGNFDQVGPNNGNGDGGLQLLTTTTYIPTTGNSEDNPTSVEDSAPLGLDDTTFLPGWVQATGREQEQANKGSCSSSPMNKKRRRRGESKGDYCSPTAPPLPPPPPPSLQFRPDSHQVGSGPAGGSTTTTTTTTTDQQDSSSQLDLLLGNDRLDTRLQLSPWSSTQSACPENRPVAVCAGAEMQPWELGEGWRQIPFSSPMPSPMELLYWPYCRLCTSFFFFFFQIFFSLSLPRRKK